MFEKTPVSHWRRMGLAALITSTALLAIGCASGLPGAPGANPAQTRNYLNSLTWAEGAGIVHNSPEARGTASLRIEPSTVAYKVSWQDALRPSPPGNGHFVVRIRNLGPAGADSLGLQPGQTGYLWVGQLSTGSPGRGAAVYRIDSTGAVQGVPAPLQLEGYCTEKHTQSAVLITDGDRCPTPFSLSAELGKPIQLASSISSGDLFLPSFARLATDANPSAFAGTGLWVTCDMGCCEVRMK